MPVIFFGFVWGNFQICPGKFSDLSGRRRRRTTTTTRRRRRMKMPRTNMWSDASVRGSHGLSGRRADKVKMPEGQKAGPKGRQLEVGAQRAPRLLV